MALFNNQATLNFNGLSINSNIVTGNIVEVLSATKTAVLDTYSQNDTVTYILSIVNAGTTACTGVTLTDNLGAYQLNETTLYPLTYVADSLTYYVNGVLTATPIVTETEPLTVTGITIPAGGNVLLIYQVRTNNFAPLSADSTITNTATLTGDCIAEELIAEETITVENAPSLSITKALSPSTVTENGTLTYTFTIVNTGNTPVVSTDNVTITDTFNPVLNDIVVTINGVPTTEYTYDEVTGLFATNEGLITVPAATFAQDAETGEYIVTPGTTVVTVTGTI